MPDFLDHRPTSTADAAVASLTRLGVAGERVDLVPVGPLEGFRGEIVGQVPAPGAILDTTTRITLYVSHNTLSDRLPGSLLEPLPSARDEARQTLEPGQAVDYWQRQVAAYGPGRQLLGVMELATQSLRRDVGRVGWSLASLSQDTTYAEQVLNLVHLADLDLSPEEKVFLATALQRMPDRVGTVSGLEKLLTSFLGVQVTTRERPGPELVVPRSEQRPLGTEGCRLGGSLALGPRFRDSRPTLLLVVGPLSLGEFVALQKDRAWRGKAESLLHVMGPAACHTEWLLMLRQSDRGACLGDTMRGRLGQTTYLTAGSSARHRAAPSSADRSR